MAADGRLEGLVRVDSRGIHMDSQRDAGKGRGLGDAQQSQGSVLDVAQDCRGSLGRTARSAVAVDIISCDYKHKALASWSSRIVSSDSHFGECASALTAIPRMY